MRKRKSPLKKMLLVGISCFVIFVVFGIVGYNVFFASPIKKVVQVEAGEQLELTPDIFVKNDKNKASFEFIEEQEILENYPVGEYTFDLTGKGKTYTAILKIVDTVAPIATISEGYVALGANFDANKVVSEIEDFSEVTARLAEDYIFDKIDDYNVKIILSDIANNETVYDTVVHCVDDVEPPVFTSIPPLYLSVNQTEFDILSDVIATDNLAQNVIIVADEVQIDTNNMNEYFVRLVAQDDVGNETVAERKVVVAHEVVFDTMMAFEQVSEETTQKINNILDEIIKPGMTAREEARAIYQWVLYNNSYRTDSQTAYLSDIYGYADEYIASLLRRNTGHCFHYAVVSGKMLQQRGFEVALLKGDGHNFDGSFSLHFWVKVKIDGQWYHFDPLFEELYLFGRSFFLVSDNNVYGSSHRWDRSKYDFN